LLVFAGVVSFFALTARSIPKKQANLYIGLFYAGCMFQAISDLYSYLPRPLHFIYAVFPANMESDVELGTSRLGGVGNAAAAVLYLMTARYGLRESVFSGRLWRPLVMGLSFIFIFLGGFRGAIIGALLNLGMVFFLEKLHRTGALLAVIFAGVLGGASLVAVVPHLPWTFQRSLAWLPIHNIDPQAKANAEASSQWRVDMWKALWPQVPEHLLLGKGYSFSKDTYDKYMGATATFTDSGIDPANGALALANDFHSGPLSLLLPFGIWGVLAWLWLQGGGFFVMWRNYRYGDPDLRHINAFLLANFTVHSIMFWFVFGDMAGDLDGYAFNLGMSIALNHGIRRPAPVSKFQPARLPGATAGSPGFAGRPALPGLANR
jgi:hypothetical protein